MSDKAKQVNDVCPGIRYSYATDDHERIILMVNHCALFLGVFGLKLDPIQLEDFERVRMTRYWAIEQLALKLNTRLVSFSAWGAGPQGSDIVMVGVPTSE